MLLSRLNMPIVTTLHTVLTNPTPAQREVTRQIIGVSTKVVVMSEKGRRVLLSAHPEVADKIEMIAHGIPDRPLVETHAAKAKFGFSGKTVILTFGLLSPNKGIETVIDAMPGIVASCPSAVYVVLGATHPNLLRDQGEAYRERLMLRAHELGVEDRVVFLNQFVDQATLLDHISMCDVYVTPYLNEAQMTSGTLAYSFGLGKAVVSTPYWHAKELLSRRAWHPGPVRGFQSHRQRDLRPSGGRCPPPLHARARLRGKPIDDLGADGRELSRRFREPPGERRSRRIARGSIRSSPIVAALRSDRFRKFGPGISSRSATSTGMLQHSVFSVADRSHGYCVDDNARALLFSTALLRNGETPLSETLTARFAAFIQHAWNPDTGRFRNFMSYDRRWLEPSGSEDSHGRTLWALGRPRGAAMRPRLAADGPLRCSRPRFPPSRTLPLRARGPSHSSGLDAYCAQFDGDAFAKNLRMQLG